MGFVNYVQYNLPFSADEDNKMKDLGLTLWGGQQSYTEPDGYYLLDEQPSAETVAIYHLGWYCKKDCQIKLINYEYFTEAITIDGVQIDAETWVAHHQTLQMGDGNKLELQNVRLAGISLASLENDNKYWGENAKLDMKVADFDTLDSVDEGITGDIDPFYPPGTTPVPPPVVKDLEWIEIEG